MKQYIFPFLFLLLITIKTFADGTKQLMPNCGTDDAPEPKGICYLALGSREGGTGPSRPFARYQHSSSKKSCSDENRLYFRVSNVGETVYLGFGGYRPNGGTSSSTPSGNNGLVKYRIKRSSSDNGYDGSDESHAGSDVIVKTEADLPSTEPNGLITSYANAYYGPKTLSFNGGTKGYTPIILDTLSPGLYYVEFDIGSDYDVATGNPFDIEWFDITVAAKKRFDQATDSVIDGRVYSKAWGLNANGSTNEVWATFYTYSTDYYTSKVYLAGVMPYRFVFGCNSYGALDTGSAEEKRQSNPNANSFKPEYLVFLTTPDVVSYEEAKIPNVPTGLTFSGDAITCEDLIFVIQLAYNESSTLELYLNGEEGEKVLIEHLDAAKIKTRGYHYPWKNNNELKIAGKYHYKPVAEGCPRRYKLSLFDQRFKVQGTDTIVNVGDKTQGILDPNATINWVAELGSANNPILIRDQTDFNLLSTAINENLDYLYTIDPFYVKPDGTPVSRAFTFSSSNGFEGIHFYLTAPSNKIKLNAGWQGIGTAANPFKGVLRCGKYNPDPSKNNTNSTETQNVGDQDTIVIQEAGIGLFNYCEGATIDNIHVKGTIEVSTSNDTVALGAICSYARNTTFSNCTNATTITFSQSGQTNAIGGIVGKGTNCIIDSCSNNVELSNSVYSTGGIVGTLNGGSANFCYNVGTIGANTYAGGIVGTSQGTISITNSKNEGAINCTNTGAGGIIGYAAQPNTTTLSDCYNSGTISSPNYTHGMVGSQGTGAKGNISNCYNIGLLSNQSQHGIADDNFFTINSSYASTDGNKKLTILSADITSGHFYDETDEQGLLATACCGKTWRNEEAGRLFKNDSLFYVSWDGKYDNGECVTGEISVDYQKNSGVTHFPFYDPENIKLNGDSKGMVVYRITPIQDLIKQNPEKYNYKELPKNYYQTTATSDTEKGIELNLYWDDRKIRKSGACTGIDGIYGSTIDTVAYTCTRKDWRGNCTRYSQQTTQYCVGIQNVTEGGYLGSEKGGHIFPASDFGNQHTINTWWNGVEVHALTTLKLTENSPAVLMPIELDSWVATPLSKSVFLEWSTATETNNHFFTLERSTNGLTWFTIGKILGSGTTRTAQEYSFEDTKPVDGISYYRIKQTDYNGDYSYTSIKCINRPKNNENSFIAYRNELLNAFIVEGEQIAACPIELYSTTGAKISNVSFNTINASKVVITLENIPIGTYFIKACNTSKAVVKSW